MNEVISLFSAIKSKSWYFSKFFIDNYNLYNTYDEFFENYKKQKIQEAKTIGLNTKVTEIIENYINGDKIKTIKGEVVRSKAEAIIANFLFTHGIEYEYEKVYDEIMDDNNIYKPDFTLELAGQEVYIEYFGLDDYKYNIIKDKKEEYHKFHHNIFVSLDRVPIEDIELILDSKLKTIGFSYKMKTNEEIYNQLLSNNPLSQLFQFKDFIYSCIECIKQSLNRDNYKKKVTDI